MLGLVKVLMLFIFKSLCHWYLNQAIDYCIDILFYIVFYEFDLFLACYWSESIRDLIYDVQVFFLSNT